LSKALAPLLRASAERERELRSKRRRARRAAPMAAPAGSASRPRRRRRTRPRHHGARTRKKKEQEREPERRERCPSAGNGKKGGRVWEEGSFLVPPRGRRGLTGDCPKDEAAPRPPRRFLLLHCFAVCGKKNPTHRRDHHDDERIQGAFWIRRPIQGPRGAGLVVERFVSPSSSRPRLEATRKKTRAEPSENALRKLRKGRTCCPFLLSLLSWSSPHRDHDHDA
jgi:hypothetical protein